MKLQKISFNQTNLIDKGSKQIYEYPLKTKIISVGYMKVNGRDPKGDLVFNLEHECQFVICVTKGNGRIILKDEVVELTQGDVMYIPAEEPFAVDGNMEYFSVDVPAFYIEQSEEVTIEKNLGT